MLPSKCVVSPRTTSGIQGNEEAKTAYIEPTWQNVPHVWQSLRQRKRNLPQYPPMGMVFSVSPDRWTAQTKTLLVSTVYAMMLVSLRSLTKTRWRHGLSTMLSCSMLNLNGQAMSSLRSLSVTCNPDPQSTQQGSWAIWNHSWDAESC